MHILLINHYAGSPRHGMEYRPYYLAREWVKQGHEVTILAASYSHLRSVSPIATRQMTEERIDGIRYLWYPTPEYRGNGIRRVWNIFSFVRQVWFDARRLACQYAPHLVIASSTYPLDVVAAQRIARITSAVLVHEVHDLWPLTPIELGGMSRWHPFIMVMQWAETYAYRHADCVVSLLPKADEYMCSRGMDHAKFHYIPNGISLDEWTDSSPPLPPLHQETLKRFIEEGQFILGYAGGHALSNALDSIIEAAKLIEHMRVKVVLVGHGAEKERLMQKAEALGLKNVTFLPPVPKSTMPNLLQTFDACCLAWARSPLYRFGVCPNKLLDYMMAGKPIIHAIEAGNDLVAESGCGISVPPEDPRAIVKAVEQLTSLEPEQRAAMGQRGKDYVIRHHQYAYLAKQFLERVCPT